MRRKIGWVQRAGGTPIIFVGGSSDRIRTALRAGTSILGMVDVPLPSSTNVVELPFLDGVGRFSDGLVRLAATEGIPIVAYLPKFDPVTGGRRLALTRLPLGGEDPMRSLAAMLDRAVRDDPPAWHLWVHWPHFMA
jgi:lauroyl/myristoyl acyltransferase